MATTTTLEWLAKRSLDTKLLSHFRLNHRRRRDHDQTSELSLVPDLGAFSSLNASAQRRAVRIKKKRRRSGTGNNRGPIFLFATGRGGRDHRIAAKTRHFFERFSTPDNYHRALQRSGGHRPCRNPAGINRVYRSADRFDISRFCFR